MAIKFIYPQDTGGQLVYYGSSAPSGVAIDDVFWFERADGIYKRIYEEGEVNIKWFGAKGDGETNDTLAVQKLSDYVNSIDGGVTVVIPKGTYIIGGQDFAASNSAGYAYRAHELFTFTNCNKPIIIEGNHSIFKLADGLKAGAFNPLTGAPLTTITMDVSKRADPGLMFRPFGNKSITLKNITFDGNIQGLVIGGEFGDTGYQVEGDGIFATENELFILENVNCINNIRDGFLLQNLPDENQKVSAESCNFIGNGRQGFSWVGGDGVYFHNTKFNNTGRTVNTGTGQALINFPGAGIDIEAEVGACNNGVFEDCEFVNNNGIAVLNPGSGDFFSRNNRFIRCLIVGTTGYSLWMNQRSVVYENCTILGAITGVYAAEGYDDPERTIFKGCIVSLDTNLSPTGQVYSDAYLIESYGNLYALFDKCTIDGADKSTGFTGYYEFSDCIIKQSSSNLSYLRGIFRNSTYENSFGNVNDFFNSKFYGRTYENGVLKPADDNILKGLQVNNFLKITSGSPASGKVLTSDAQGNATWQPTFGYWTASGSNIYNNNTGNVSLGTSSDYGSKLNIKTATNDTASSGIDIKDSLLSTIFSVRGDGFSTIKGPVNIGNGVITNPSLTIEGDANSAYTGIQLKGGFYGGAFNQGRSAISVQQGLTLDSFDGFHVSTSSTGSLTNATEKFSISGTGVVKLLTAPATGASNDKVLVRSTDGTVKQVDGTTITGYWTASGNDIYNNNSGNVCVGRTSGAFKLDVYSPTQYIARFGSDVGLSTGIIIQNSNDTEGASFVQFRSSIGAGAPVTNGSIVGIGGGVELRDGSNNIVVKVVSNTLVLTSGSVNATALPAYSTGGYQSVVRNATTGLLQAAPNPQSLSTASALTLQYSGDYVFKGTTATYTLPAIDSGIKGRNFIITIKNRGSGVLTVNTNATDQIWPLDNTPVTTIGIAPGNSVDLMPDGEAWNIK